MVHLCPVCMVDCHRSVKQCRQKIRLHVIYSGRILAHAVHHVSDVGSFQALKSFSDHLCGINLISDFNRAIQHTQCFSDDLYQFVQIPDLVPSIIRLEIIIFNLLLYPLFPFVQFLNAVLIEDRRKITLFLILISIILISIICPTILAVL